MIEFLSVSRPRAAEFAFYGCLHLRDCILPFWKPLKLLGDVYGISHMFCTQEEMG
jgi:hypothetical protein